MSDAAQLDLPAAFAEAERLHNLAMESADAADLANRKGAFQSGASRMLTAFQMERAAADLIPVSANMEPSRSILYKSAAWLALDCYMHSEARRMVARAREGNPPAGIDVELSQISERLDLYDRTRAEAKAVSLAPLPFPLPLPDLSAPDPVPGVIFTFGSNFAGIHGKGAAKTARLLYGAQQYKGAGLTGNAFALPTKDGGFKVLPLPLIKVYTDRFLTFARSRASGETDALRWFLVTRIGCGEARYTDAEIAPLFVNAPPNCILPEAWQPFVPDPDGRRAWHNREGQSKQ